MATRMPPYMGERTSCESLMGKKVIVDFQKEDKKERVVYETLAAAIQVFEKETEIKSMDAMFLDGYMNYKMSR